MTPKLKDKCEGIQAPDGWKFQDCDDRRVTLLRQSNVKWTENDWRNRNPKDAYIITWLYDDPDEWEIHLFSTADTILGDYESGEVQLTKKNAIKETVCMAIFTDVWDELEKEGVARAEIRSRSDRALNKCRDNSGL